MPSDEKSSRQPAKSRIVMAIHFAAENEAAIKATQQYQATPPFGNDTAEVFFDL